MQPTNLNKLSFLALRVMGSLIFITAAFNHLFQTEQAAARLEKASLGFLATSMASPELLVLLSGFGLLTGGFLLLAGYQTRLAALLLFAILIPITITMQMGSMATVGPLFKNIALMGILLFFIATVFAVILIYLFTPLYNQISGKNLSFDITNPVVFKGAGFAILGTLIASSIYPAFLLSSFKPIQALKGKITSGVGIASLRKGLVVFQFAISVILLICTMVMGRQLNFIKNKNLGYDKSYVFSVPLTQEVADHLDAVKAELKKETSISNVASSNVYNFTDIDGKTGDLDWPERTDNTSIMITQVMADKELIPTMRIKLLEGQNFAGTPADSSGFIVNETAVKKIGLKQPIGQQITFHDHKGTIIGVVKDFNFKSLKEKISPLIFFTFWNFRNILHVRTTGTGAQQAIAATAAQYKKYAGDSPFGYHFLDQSFEAHYKTDQRAGTLFNVFAGIAIFISCLGLFGLATYTAQVKFKEIGIRKVLGASVAGIVRLISIDFIKLVFVAI
ncbi:MAG: DoxX family membrane protein, partial [Sphingobacteriaceae bacterium]